MSAFLCSHEQIALVAIHLRRITRSYGEAPAIAKVLAEANVASVFARYEGRHGTHDVDAEQVYINNCADAARGDLNDFLVIPPLRLIGLAHCQHYQSCDHPAYAGSLADQMLNHLFRDSVFKHLEATGNGQKWGWAWANDAVVTPRQYAPFGAH